MPKRKEKKTGEKERFMVAESSFGDDAALKEELTRRGYPLVESALDAAVVVIENPFPNDIRTATMCAKRPVWVLHISGTNVGGFYTILPIKSFLQNL